MIFTSASPPCPRKQRDAYIRVVEKSAGPQHVRPIGKNIQNVRNTAVVEMSQNAIRLNWNQTEVDKRLHDIMINIHAAARAAATEFGEPDNYVMGANIAGFRKVADAMLDLGV